MRELRYIKNGKLVLDGTIKECDLEEKCLLALEIIGKCDVDLHALKATHTWEEYIVHCWKVGAWYSIIGTESYDLLKEVLQ